MFYVHLSLKVPQDKYKVMLIRIDLITLYAETQVDAFIGCL